MKQPNINSDEYKEAALVEDRCRAAIKAELDKHRAQAIILLFGSHRIWGVGGWPMVTVPLGYLPEDNEIIAATVTDRYGKTPDCPGGLLQVFPNR